MKLVFTRSVIVIITISTLIIGGIFFYSRTVNMSNTSPTTRTSESKYKMGGRLDLEKFSIDLPEGWIYESQTGIDSFVGAFKGNGVTVLFDYGYYSNTLASEDNPEYLISYETIDGKKAKIVKSKIPNAGLTGVYFSNVSQLDNTFNMYAENVPQELVEKIIELFRTIKF